MLVRSLIRRSNNQTTIILFTRNASSHKADWIVSEMPLTDLSCLLHCWVNSLMNALVIVVCVFCLNFSLQCCRSLVTYLSPFLYDVVGVLLCIRCSCKQVHGFVFVYHFNNTISIYAIILLTLIFWSRFLKRSKFLIFHWTDFVANICCRLKHLSRSMLVGKMVS